MNWTLQQKSSIFFTVQNLIGAFASTKYGGDSISTVVLLTEKEKDASPFHIYSGDAFVPI